MTNEANAVEVTETDFTFRTNKETGFKRPTVSLKYPVISGLGIATLLVDNADSKEAKLALDAVQSIVSSYVRGLVDSDSEFDQAKLDALISENKISLEAIANLPKSERNVLSREDMEAFAKDYIKIMPEITGKSEAKVTSAAGLFVERFKRVAGDNDILKILQDQLTIFVDKAPEDVAATHEKAITYLAGKLEELLSVKVTADAL